MSSPSLDSAERAVLGCTLLDTRCYDEAALHPKMFYHPVYGAVWESIGKLYTNGKQVDPITVCEITKGASPSDLSGLVANAPVADTISHWAGIVRDHWIQRSIATISSDYNKWRDRGLNGTDMLSRVRDTLEDIEGSAGRSLSRLSDYAEKERDICTDKRVETVQQSLKTTLGIERVVPGGFPANKITVIYGESGNFKTTVKNGIVWNLAENGYTVLDVSLEDSDELTSQRYLASISGVPFSAIAIRELTAKQREAVAAAKLSSTANNIIMGGEIPPDIDEIIRMARYYKRQANLSAVAVDYVQLIEGNRRSSEREVINNLMRKAQLSAKRDNIAYIFVSQVKQDVDQRDDHRPRITDMLGSSAIRTHSKLAIGVYRPYLYNREPNGRRDSEYQNLYLNHPDGENVYKNLLELHVMKNILGEAYVRIHLLARPEYGTVEPFDMRGWLT